MSNSNEQLDPNDIFSMSEDELSKFDPEKAAAEADALAAAGAYRKVSGVKAIKAVGVLG